MEDQAKYLGLVAAFVVLVAVSLGCATTVALSSSGNSSAYYSTPVLKDSVYAIGRPDAASAQKLGNVHVVAFLGKANSYLLLEGGDELMQIAQQLDGNLVSLETPTRGLYIKDKKVWGALSLVYARKGANPYSSDEIEMLTRLRFTMHGKSGVYRKNITVKGLLYPPVVTSEEQEQRFKVTRQLAFYNPPESSPPPDFSKLATVPVAIVVDVVTLPLQLVVAGLVVVGVTLHH